MVVPAGHEHPSAARLNSDSGPTMMTFRLHLGGKSSHALVLHSARKSVTAEGRRIATSTTVWKGNHYELTRLLRCGVLGLNCSETFFIACRHVAGPHRPEDLTCRFGAGDARRATLPIGYVATPGGRETLGIRLASSMLRDTDAATHRLLRSSPG